MTIHYSLNNKVGAPDSNVSLARKLVMERAQGKWKGQIIETTLVFLLSEIGDLI